MNAGDDHLRSLLNRYHWGILGLATLWALATEGAAYAVGTALGMFVMLSIVIAIWRSVTRWAIGER